jgi:hypothetical protein
MTAGLFVIKARLALPLGREGDMAENQETGLRAVGWTPGASEQASSLEGCGDTDRLQLQSHATF